VINGKTFVVLTRTHIFKLLLIVAITNQKDFIVISCKYVGTRVEMVNAQVCRFPNCAHKKSSRNKIRTTQFPARLLKNRNSGGD